MHALHAAGAPSTGPVPLAVMACQKHARQAGQFAAASLSTHRLVAPHAERLQLQRLRIAICCVDMNRSRGFLLLFIRSCILLCCSH